MLLNDDNDDDKNIYTVKVILRFPPTPLLCYADGRINKKKNGEKIDFL